MASRRTLMGALPPMRPLCLARRSFPVPSLRIAAIRCRYASDQTLPSEFQPQSVAPMASLDPPIADQLLPYHVSRTPSHELPVYKDLKAGGTLKQTRIRKISGDVHALKEELQKSLRLSDERIKVNTLTQHIVIKGWHRAAVLKFLEGKNF